MLSSGHQPFGLHSPVVLQPPVGNRCFSHFKSTLYAELEKKAIEGEDTNFSSNLIIIVIIYWVLTTCHSQELCVPYDIILLKKRSLFIV